MIWYSYRLCLYLLGNILYTLSKALLVSRVRSIQNLFDCFLRHLAFIKKYIIVLLFPAKNIQVTSPCKKKTDQKGTLILIPFCFEYFIYIHRRAFYLIRGKHFLYILKEFIFFYTALNNFHRCDLQFNGFGIIANEFVINFRLILWKICFCWDSAYCITIYMLPNFLKKNFLEICRCNSMLWFCENLILVFLIWS